MYRLLVIQAVLLLSLIIGKILWGHSSDVAIIQIPIIYPIITEKVIELNPLEKYVSGEKRYCEYINDDLEDCRGEVNAVRRTKDGKCVGTLYYLRTHLDSIVIEKSESKDCYQRLMYGII